MPDPRRHAAAFLAVLLLAVPSAQAAEPVLLAQLDDATLAQSEEESQPPLSEEPPGELGSGDAGPTPPEDSGEEEGSGSKSAGEREPLPETGIETGLIALLGLGLIASGSGLRLTLGRDAV